MPDPAKETGRDCEKEDCFFYQVEAQYRHVCQHCDRNKKSKDKEDDYFSKLRKGGY